MAGRLLNSLWGLIGNAKSIGRLQQMAAASRIPPALLFTGPVSTGRRAAALEFGRALMCRGAMHGTACGKCTSCRRISSDIDRHNHPDVDIWSVERQAKVAGTSKSGALTIETVRAIASSAALRPYESNRRLVIIDDAEQLGEDAQQALLKTLEDAPNYVSIILIATSADGFLETMRSRVVEVPFQLGSTPEIAAGLGKIRPGSDAAQIASLANGRPGWAIAAVDSPSHLEQERKSSESIEHWIAASARDRVIEAFRRGDAFARDRSAETSRRLLTDLDRAIVMWRDMLLHATSNDQLAFDPQRVRRLDPASRLTMDGAYKALIACRQCQFDLSHNVRPKLALELMVIQWPNLS